MNYAENRKTGVRARLVWMLAKAAIGSKTGHPPDDNSTILSTVLAMEQSTIYCGIKLRRIPMFQTRIVYNG